MSTIKQKTISIPVDGGAAIAVRRMRWKAAREFLQKLSTHLGGLRKLEDVVAQLPTLITSADELLQHLIASSTDLTATQVDDLDTLQIAEIVRAALELNCGEDLKNSFAGIAATIGGLVPAITTTSTGSSTPTSSTPATAPTT